SQSLELHTISQLSAQCGDNLTLPCVASSSGQLKIISFEWLKNKSVCQYKNGSHDPKVLCSTAEPPQYGLTLTVLNVTPNDRGTYHCKLRSTSGVKDKTTAVTVKDCLKDSGSNFSDSNAKCWFTGVYPSGTVHWSQGDLNLTGFASTEETVDSLELYEIRSTVDAQKGNLSQPYNCSLWIPSAGKYLHSRQVHVTGKQTNGSPGDMVKLQWICIMVEIIMLKFLI
ncbi:tyrosine-protein phosphatase non-receptor type substrate 1-like, partial [Plectropomus leopardus]|uniref:tyrosine-protein phosphatase non-receptor type substrate 1-like n=1 Tax=Plectropomus leopardus TaxID=160734 RepID=UPI001C4D2C8F